MQFKRPKRTPLFLALAVLALVGGVRCWNPSFPERLENITYDFRVRAAQNNSTFAATNLAFVAMEDSSIAAVNDGKVNGLKLGYHSGLYWQRTFMAGSSANSPRRARRQSRSTCCSANSALIIRRCKWRTAG